MILTIIMTVALVSDKAVLRLILLKNIPLGIFTYRMQYLITEQIYEESLSQGTHMWLGLRTSASAPIHCIQLSRHSPYPAKSIVYNLEGHYFNTFSFSSICIVCSHLIFLLVFAVISPPKLFLTNEHKQIAHSFFPIIQTRFWSRFGNQN